jgi:hypothetical protein
MGETGYSFGDNPHNQSSNLSGIRTSRKSLDKRELIGIVNPVSLMRTKFILQRYIFGDYIHSIRYKTK